MNLSIKTLSVVAVIALLISMIFFGYPQYKVWQQRLAGQAELARAEQKNRHSGS